MKSMRTRPRSSFTIVGLLVVVAIFGVPVSHLRPAVPRLAERGSQCISVDSVSRCTILSQ